jgi:hypothetical protein
MRIVFSTRPSAATSSLRCEILFNPFRVTTLYFRFLSRHSTACRVLPDTLLGESAPRLQSLHLNNVPFPAIRKLLLSTTDLVTLHLSDIPDSGYISPETMVTCLCALIQLESLLLRFRTPRPRPDQTSRRLPPLTRAVVHALTSLQFVGVSEYLEEGVARIHASVLHIVGITFFNQLIFDIPRVPQFLSLTEKL